MSRSQAETTSETRTRRSPSTAPKATERESGAWWQPLAPVAIFGLLLVGLWEGITRALDVPKWLLPSPSLIGRALIRGLPSLIQEHSTKTLVEAVSGYGLAALGGVGLGTLVHQFKLVRKILYPILVLSQTIPLIVLAPLLVIWLGYGAAPKIVVVAIACFFPIAVNTVDGLDGADPDMIKLVASMGGSRWQGFRMVRFPAALPTLFSGLRVSASYAVMGAVIAEWMGADGGLGVFIMRSAHSFRTEQVFAGVVLVSLYSMTFFGLISLVERRAVPWQEKERKSQ